LHHGPAEAPRQNGGVEFRLDRRALTITTFAEDARTNRPLAYWRSRPPTERVADRTRGWIRHCRRARAGASPRAACRPKDLADVEALREPEN